MTGLRDELHLLARQAPAVDLAERAVRGARRRRRIGLYGSALATLVAVALGATVLAGGLLGGAEQGTISGRVTDVLPTSGVDPLAYAYYDMCGVKWTPGKNTGEFAGKDCVQWHVVTRTGQNFRMPEALSFYTDQSEQNYMNTAAPVAITPDGRRIAYYSEKDQRFAVRDLASGDVRLAPQTVSRATMVTNGGLLRLSPDGRHLGLYGFGGLDAVVDMDAGRVHEIPAGWHVHSVPDGGSPVVLVNEQDRYALLIDGQARPFAAADVARQVSELAPDGRRVAYLTGGTPGLTSGGAQKSRPDDTIVTVDATTGRILSRVRIRDEAERFPSWRIGGWRSPTEVVVSAAVIDRSWTASRTGRPVEGRVPTLGETAYALDVTTGAVRRLRAYTFRGWSGDIVLPGF
ncbi:hypothetical protein ACGF0J_00440 [Nonomuraea sp. NPDC047897]|uniref:hypothetical protein n=1 Tax=Nonomuraea sp. NPDC047897 TaxID=3364346 RepID=UPI0037136559